MKDYRGNIQKSIIELNDDLSKLISKRFNLKQKLLEINSDIKAKQEMVEYKKKTGDTKHEIKRKENS